jgi:hypothetical protein
MAPAHELAGACFMLNDSQRRHVAVFLARLEEELDEIERLATQPVRDDRVLARERADVPRRYLASAEEDLRLLRAEVRGLATALRLAPRERSRSRQARALLGAALVQLEETRGRSLRAYGAVDAGAVSELDPALDAIRKCLERLLDRLAHPDPVGGIP